MTLFLYCEESLVSSNLNSKQLRFLGVRPNVGARSTRYFRQKSNKKVVEKNTHYFLKMALQSSVGFRGHFALYFLTSLSISWLDWKTFQIRGWQLVQSGLPRLHYQLRERGFPSGVGDFAILRLRNGVKSILKEHLTKRSALVNEISF